MEHLFRERIGEELKKKRQSQKLSQEEMAEYLSQYGISEIQYKRAERGEDKVSVDSLYHILQSLDIEPMSIFPEDPARVVFAKYFDFMEDYIDAAERRSFYPKPEDIDRALEYQRRSLFRFLLYLPLISPLSLADSLYRIAGSFKDQEEYVLNQVSYLVGSIPDSDAKRLAEHIDKGLSHIPLSNPIEEFRWQKDYYMSRRSEEFKQWRCAYWRVLEQNYKIALNREPFVKEGL